MTTPTDGAHFDRRQFLKLGATGTLTLLALGSAATLAGCARKDVPAAGGHQWLSTEDLALFAALLPAVNGASMPQDAEIRNEALRRVDLACISLDPPARAELRKLLELLHWSGFRRLMCGVSTPWTQASHTELSAFLQRWRDSRLALFNAGHRALVKLAALGWWSQPASWVGSRYPGPPAWAVEALQT